MSQGRVDLNQGTGAEGVVGRIVENSEEEGGRALFEGNKKPSRMRGGLSGQGGNRTPDTRIFSTDVEETKTCEIAAIYAHLPLVTYSTYADVTQSSDVPGT